MSRIFKDGWNSAVVHQIAIARFILFTLVTLAGAMLAALSGMDWATSDGQTRFMVGLGILVSWGGAMLAFFDQSIKRASEGKDPLTGASLPPFGTKQTDETIVKSTTITTTP